MTTEQEKVCKVVYSALVSEGWINAADKLNCFYKDGCQLILYETGAVEYVVEECKAGSIGGVVSPRSATGNTWQLERDGVVIDAGRLAMSISVLFDNDSNLDCTAASNELNKFITRINTAMGWTVYQQFANRMPELVTYTTKKGMVAKETGKLVLSDGQATVFKVNKDMPPWFFKDSIYAINNIDDNSVSMLRLNKACTGFLSTPIIMDDRAYFIQLCKNRELVNVNIVEDKIRIPHYSLAQSSKQYDDLPDEVKELNLSMAEQIAVGELYNSNYNYTYVLQGGVKPDALNLLMELCKAIGYVGECDLAGFTSENGNAVIEAVKSGFRLEEVLGKTSAEISNWLKEQRAYVSEVVELISQNNVNTSVIGVLPYVLDSVNVWELKDIRSPYELLLNVNALKGICPKTAEHLKNNGVNTGKLLKAKFARIDSNLRMELMQYFGMVDFKFKQSMWSNALTGAVSRAINICYSVELGYLLQVDNQFLGRDNNSLVVYDTELVPMWRGVYVNEKIISNPRCEQLVSM